MSRHNVPMYVLLVIVPVPCVYLSFMISWCVPAPSICYLFVLAHKILHNNMQLNYGRAKLSFYMLWNVHLSISECIEMLHFGTISGNYQSYKLVVKRNSHKKILSLLASSLIAYDTWLSFYGLLCKFSKMKKNSCDLNFHIIFESQSFSLFMLMQYHIYYKKLVSYRCAISEIYLNPAKEVLVYSFF